MCACLCTCSLYRVCQDPVSSVVLGVVDESVFNKSQIDSWGIKKDKRLIKVQKASEYIREDP